MALNIINNIITFDVTSTFLNQCFTDAPDDIKSYDNKCIIHLLWPSVTAGQPGWTNDSSNNWVEE